MIMFLVMFLGHHISCISNDDEVTLHINTTTTSLPLLLFSRTTFITDLSVCLDEAGLNYTLMRVRVEDVASTILLQFLPSRNPTYYNESRLVNGLLQREAVISYLVHNWTDSSCYYSPNISRYGLQKMVYRGYIPVDIPTRFYHSIDPSGYTKSFVLDSLVLDSIIIFAIQTGIFIWYLSRKEFRIAFRYRKGNFTGNGPTYFERIKEMVDVLLVKRQSHYNVIKKKVKKTMRKNTEDVADSLLT